MRSLVVALEIIQEYEELKELGLSEEEVLGYFDFYSDSFFNEEEYNNAHIRISLPEVFKDTRKTAQTKRD